MRLSARDFDDIQLYIDLTRDTLAALGLSLRVDNDMQRFADYLRDQPKNHGVPNTHDPARTYLHPGNSFWVYVQEGATGRFIACHGQRLLVTDDFIEDCMAQTYFEDLMPGLFLKPIGLYPEAGSVHIGGRVVLGGGTCIHPDWRGRGCSSSTAARVASPCVTSAATICLAHC